MHFAHGCPYLSWEPPNCVDYKSSCIKVVDSRHKLVDSKSGNAYNMTMDDLLFIQSGSHKSLLMFVVDLLYQI